MRDGSPVGTKHECSMTALPAAGSEVEVKPVLAGIPLARLRNARSFTSHPNTYLCDQQDFPIVVAWTRATPRRRGSATKHGRRAGSCWRFQSPHRDRRRRRLGAEHALVSLTPLGGIDVQIGVTRKHVKVGVVMENLRFGSYGGGGNETVDEFANSLPLPSATAVEGGGIVIVSRFGWYHRRPSQEPPQAQQM